MYHKFIPTKQTNSVIEISNRLDVLSGKDFLKTRGEDSKGVTTIDLTQLYYPNSLIEHLIDFQPKHPDGINLVCRVNFLCLIVTNVPDFLNFAIW